MPKVYVTQETGFNFTDAENFGTVEFITRDDLNNMKGSLHNERVVRDIRRKLRDFNLDEDFIVIAGSPYVSALVFTLLGMRGVRTLRILRWDNRDQVYIPMQIEIPTYVLGRIAE